MKTFSIQVLGCKVNQYEAEQMANLLRRRGLTEARQGAPADLRIVHTCSVTAEAGKKSAQAIRRVNRLNVLPTPFDPSQAISGQPAQRTLVTGCWATSHPDAARALAGVDAVIDNQQDVSARLTDLLDTWVTTDTDTTGGTPHRPPGSPAPARPLSLLPDRRSANQRAYLKIQDGCDAYCTYCIIPQLRPTLWSKPIADCIAEAQSLVDHGHVEIILTGIFLGAYGHPTALRRRQSPQAGSLPGLSAVEGSPGSLSHLVEKLCTSVKGLKRLRLSSLEPGDLTAELLSVLKSHPQCVPHFHLPLQSGSDEMLRRMNRQYRRDDFVRMIDAVHSAFDRPAITTDIIVGFPGETDAAFADTLQLADHAGFIHTHAFTYSPRPNTAAARWTDRAVAPQEANERIHALVALAERHSQQFRRQFIGATAEVLVERSKPDAPTRHGRCERYFDIHFPAAPHIQPGQAVAVRIETIEGDRTHGTMIDRS